MQIAQSIPQGAMSEDLKGFFAGMYRNYIPETIRTGDLNEKKPLRRIRIWIPGPVVPLFFIMPDSQPRSRHHDL